MFWISSRKIISSTNKCRKQMLNFVWNNNESTGEILSCIVTCTISLNFEIYFLKFPWKLIWVCLKLQERVKRTVKYQMLSVVQGFCTLIWNNSILFPIWFRHLIYGQILDTYISRWQGKLILFCSSQLKTKRRNLH